MTEQATNGVRQRRRRAIDVDGSEGTIEVRRTVYGNEITNEERVRVPVFNTDPARVKVHGGVTSNEGDFNSVRVDVTVDLPCYPEESEIEHCYRYGSDLVDRLVARELMRARGQDPDAQNDN